MTLLRALRSVVIDWVVDWVVGPDDDDPIPKHCQGCGTKRPKDPLLRERWEFEHEEHEAMPW